MEFESPVISTCGTSYFVLRPRMLTLPCPPMLKQIHRLLASVFVGYEVARGPLRPLTYSSSVVDETKCWGSVNLWQIAESLHHLLDACCLVVWTSRPDTLCMKLSSAL